MTSLQNLWHKKDKLLTLLESSAKEAGASVQALVSASQNAEDPGAAQDLLYCRVVERSITEQIHEHIHNTPVAALDCEDIEKLSYVLDKIPKLANKFRDRLVAAPDFARRMDFTKQLGYLKQASELLVELVNLLQTRLNLERVKDLTTRLQFIEREADQCLKELYKDLYAGNYSAEQMLVLKDLYELLEKLVDRHRTAGNIILLITRRNC